jgi:hypothetical protein
MFLTAIKPINNNNNNNNNNNSDNVYEIVGLLYSTSLFHSCPRNNGKKTDR